MSENENELEPNLFEESQELMVSEGLTTETEETEAEPIPSQLEPIQARSIIESILLASDKPLGMASFKEVFKGTNIKTAQIREALEALTVEYAGAERGFTLIEVGGGYQLRTKSENAIFVRRMMKGRPFKLSGPALEVLAIIAYKQPIIKSEVDEIRGVESGHLMRALMDRGLIRFDGKSELPGKPMLYGSTRKFLEIFGLKDIRELPSLSEIDQLIPEGIGADEAQKQDQLSDMHAMGLEYQPDPEREVEWEKISTDIAAINTSSDFFEKEKIRQREERDLHRAEDIREKLALGEDVEAKDQKWLVRYDAKKSANENSAVTGDAAGEAVANDDSPDRALTPKADGLSAASKAERQSGDDFTSGAGSTSASIDQALTDDDELTDFPIDPDAVENESADLDASAEIVGDDLAEGAIAPLADESTPDGEANSGKLGEILEGLKSKNAETKEGSASEREHLKQSVYRPDQLAQALKDFENDDD